MVESEEDIMEDLNAAMAEERIVDLFLHHKQMLINGFVRHNAIDAHNDGICIGLATAYEVMTGEGIDAAIDRFYPPPETTEEMMAGPQLNEITH